MTDELFLQEVKRHIHDVDPQAEVWLFGSRARGDAREDSDWDFLVLTDKPVNQSYKRLVRDNLFYLELDSERVIGTVIQNRMVWTDLELTHLYQNVREDGTSAMIKTKEEIITFRLIKADKDLKTAKTLIEAQDWEVAVNRLYYAAFHGLSTLLFKNDIKVKAHAGAKAMLELHFIKTGLLPVKWGKFYAELFNERNDSDYEDFAIFSAEDVLPLLPQTEEFIDVIKRLINTN